MLGVREDKQKVSHVRLRTIIEILRRKINEKVFFLMLSFHRMISANKFPSRSQEK